MAIIRIILIAVVLTLAAFAAMALVGMALSLLRILFWLAVVCVVVALVAKLFSARQAEPEVSDNRQDKLSNAELTLEEYRRKLEAQVQESRAKRP